MAIKDEIMFLIRIRKQLETLSSTKSKLDEVFVNMVAMCMGISGCNINKEAIDTVYEIYDIKVDAGGKLKPSPSTVRNGC